MNIPTYRGDVRGDRLGFVLPHEHLFVLDPTLDREYPHPEWDAQEAVEGAVTTLNRLSESGVDTVVDLTVLGLGRDTTLVAEVARRTRVNIVAATGYYTDAAVAPFFRMRGPGTALGGPDMLTEYFLRDIREGIGDSRVRAGVVKVVSGAAGITPELARVWQAAATVHHETGVPIATHSDSPSRGGLAQIAFLRAAGVALDRVVIGHAGDSTQLDYLLRLADFGVYLGFDRFGMAHTGSDATRTQMLIELIDRGYEKQLLLSHDAAIFSRVTPPSWRRATTPDWHMGHLVEKILPRLRERGVDEDVVHTMTVVNPARWLAGAPQ